MLLRIVVVMFLYFEISMASSRHFQTEPVPFKTCFSKAIALLLLVESLQIKSISFALISRLSTNICRKVRGSISFTISL